MLEKLSSFWYYIAAEDVNITALLDIGLVQKSQMKWLGTSPDAISLIVDTLDYLSWCQKANKNIANNVQSIQS